MINFILQICVENSECMLVVLSGFKYFIFVIFVTDIEPDKL